MSRQRFSASRYNIRGIVESANLFLFANKTLKKLRCPKASMKSSYGGINRLLSFVVVVFVDFFFAKLK